MFPPDDNHHDDAPSPETGPGEAEIRAVLARIPADFYERVAPLLQLCAVANYLLLGRSGDPAPQVITQLTGFDLAATARVSRVRDSGSLGRLLLEEPETLYDFLLVGQLVFESPLFDQVRLMLGDPEVQDSADVADSLRAFVVELSEAILDSLTHYLTQDDADLRQDLRLRHLQLESIFARLADTLQPMQLPLDAVETGDNTASDELAPSLSLSFAPAQLAALQLALALPEQLADGWEQPFAQALTELPYLRPGAILHQRLLQVQPHQEVELTLHELRLLYQAAQVCALILVSDLLEAVDSAESLQVEPSGALLEYCTELEVFVQFIQAAFPDEPELQAARREVEALVELL